MKDTRINDKNIEDANGFDLEDSLINVTH